METKAYYLRNEQEDSDGRLAKWEFKPNWRELMDAGESTKRGDVPGDALVLVNRNAEVFNSIEEENLIDAQIAEAMFALYNRGSGQEREFAGPSMSTGDVVALVRGAEVILLQVADFGFIPAVLMPEVTNGAKQLL